VDNVTFDATGLSNQFLAYIQYRNLFPAMIPSYTVMQPHISSAIQFTASSLSTYFQCTGAVQGSENYQNAYMEPAYATFQAFALQGYLSYGNYCNWDQGYPLWEMDTMTPPEPRFGNVRKHVEIGAGYADANKRIGLLATGLQASYPTVSANLAWMWQQSNNSTYQTQDNAFITTLAQINPLLPATPPTLTSNTIPGYWSHSRYNFSTPHETALWFINGGFYSEGGHRDFDDGQVTIYAHSAPLAIDYTTSNASLPSEGMYLHNRVVFDSELSSLNIVSGGWTGSNPSTALGELFGSPTNTCFMAFTYSTKSCATFLLPADGTTWNRDVLHINADPTYPLIYVNDTFPSGSSASSGKTVSWNMMADYTQPVSTPSGSVTPTVRVSTCTSTPNQYPSTGTVYALSTGWQPFSFTGFAWPQHATQGINWNMWVNAPAGDGQFFLGNWGAGPNCNTGIPDNEYNTANGTAAVFHDGGTTGYYEQQDILRVHSAGSIGTLFAPYRKTETPTETLSSQTCGTQIVLGSETTCFNNSAMTYTNGTAYVLTTYDSSTQTAFNMTASGGAQELVQNGATITWTISDIVAGTRNATLPTGTWSPSIPVQYSNGTYSYYSAGGAQPTPVVITFTQQQAALRTVALDYAAPTGATQIRVKFGSTVNYAALASCNPVCSITMQSPTGTWPEQHDFLNGNGAIVASSLPQNVVVQ
jgi:hypothetical protein